MLQTLKKYPVCVSLLKGLDAVSIVQPLINAKPGFNIMEKRICSKCKIPKDYGEFNKNKTGKYGLNSRCKKCIIEYNKKYYKRNDEKRKKQSKEWREANIEKEAILKKKMG